MAKNIFIALEGLSGTGKTEVGRRVAMALDGIYYKTPPAPFDRIRDEVDRICGLAERYFFYLAGVVFASSDIRRLIESKPVVCDRYILTTQNYHLVAGVTALVPLSSLNILLPDLTVLITCEQQERQRRLALRGLSYNDLQERQLGIDDSLLEAYRTSRIFEIDSTHAGPDEIASCILARVSLGANAAHP